MKRMRVILNEILRLVSKMRSYGWFLRYVTLQSKITKNVYKECAQYTVGERVRKWGENIVIGRYLLSLHSQVLY